MVGGWWMVVLFMVVSFVIGCDVFFLLFFSS